MPANWTLVPKIRPEHAARVLAVLPESFAMEVVMRMLRMEAVQKEVLDDVERTLRNEFMSNLAKTNRRDSHELMADIFNYLDRALETRFLTALEERNRDSAERIKALMFTFEDLRKLDPSGVQTLLRGLAGLSPLIMFRKMRPVWAFAFSTASSGATLPVTLRTVEKKLGVNNSVAGFTVPLGATINMDGTAIMQGVATVFIANVYGVDLTLTGHAHGYQRLRQLASSDRHVVPGHDPLVIDRFPAASHGTDGWIVRVDAAPERW